MSRIVCFVFGLLLAHGVAAQLSWVGNTTLSPQGGGSLPRRAAFVERWQSVRVECETWPIAGGQRVFLVATTDNFQSTREYEFSFVGNFGNNSRWRVEVPAQASGTDLQFYIRATGNGGQQVFDNNNWQNFGYYARYAPRGPKETILQWFETDYRTMLKRLPEVVLAGYTAIYLAPPSKAGGGGLSVGYNPTDRFDLGDRLTGGTVRTKYGTTHELADLIAGAKRMGLRVYCDVVFNHNDNRASTAINRYPDAIPEDFHIRSSSDTGNSEVDFNRESSFSFGMLNHDLVGLVDIAQEDQNNTRTGSFNLPPYAQFNQFGKPAFVRHPITPQYYPGGNTVAEDVREMLRRWGWFLTSVLGFDGYRFDAVKHTPPAFFDSAPDQPGSPSSRGDLTPYLYSLNPDANLFAEDFTDNAWELREYAKSGLNLLDFPLKFKLDSVFNSSGFGNIGQALGNAYGLDSSTGLPYELGGLGQNVGVGFVQSHDSLGPYSSNIAHAFALLRPGAAKVYYDGNNIDPADTTNFPKPGRADALGAGSDLLLRILDARRRFGRGDAAVRWASGDVLVLERQVSGSGVLLVGLNDNGASDQTVTVQTAFAPGTVLADLAGQRGSVVVGSDGRAAITIPHNSTGGPQNNGKGYVLYAARAPAGAALPVRLFARDDSGAEQELAFRDVAMPAGRYASPGSIRAATTTRDRLRIRVETDATGVSAGVKLDSGMAMAGRAPLSGTPEGLLDGYVPLDRVQNGVFELREVDLGSLAEGLHVLRARVFADTGNRPGVFSDFVAFFYVDRDRGWSLDGELAEFGQALASQGRNPSSNSNRLDALYATNDGSNLYIGLAGTVSTDERFTNGVALWIDTGEPGNPVRDLQALNDDSGPAPRLLSNANVTLPSTFEPDFGLGVLRQSQIHSAPEAPSLGDVAVPPFIGAFAGLYRVDAQNPFWLQRQPLAVAWKPRANRTDPARGLEAALPLRSLFPSGLRPGSRIRLIGYLLTTGETGTTLLSSDPLRGVLGGRPAAISWVSNQFLPVQGTVNGDPGTGRVATDAFASFDLQFARRLTPGRGLVLGSPLYDPARRLFVQRGQLTNLAAEPLPGPIAARVALPAGVTLVDSWGPSAVDPAAEYRVLKSGGLAAGERMPFVLEYRSDVGRGLSPRVEVFSGRGAL